MKISLNTVKQREMTLFAILNNFSEKASIKMIFRLYKLERMCKIKMSEIRTENPSGCIGWIHHSNCVFANII